MTTVGQVLQDEVLRDSVQHPVPKKTAAASTAAELPPDATSVQVTSRAAQPFRMRLRDDRREYVISRGVNLVPRDFLDAWAAANWDAESLRLLSWDGHDATRRAGRHEVDGVVGT